MGGTFARRIVNTVFPPLCPVTGAETGTLGTLSPEAWADLARLSGTRCDACGRELPGAAPEPPPLCEACTRTPRPWARGAAAMRYEGTGRALVLSLKHRDRLDLVPMLAGWMLQARPALVAEAELVAPVPLHWRRLLARRFNQSAELARALCRIAGRRRAYAPRLLRRSRHTPPQGADRAARTANVAGAFAPGAGPPVAGRRVLLVDDVMTTGATLAACTQVLLDAGARSVDILVAALVVRDPPPYLAVGSPDGEEMGETGHETR